MKSEQEFCHNSRCGLSLGELIAALRELPGDTLVFIDSPVELVPGKLHSYRGYYSDLAIEPEAHIQVPIAAQFADTLADVIGRQFEGFKGGLYTMTADTAVWVSEYGRASGMRVTAVRHEGVLALIETEEEQ